MLKLRENEKILLVLHKHWFELTGPVITFFVLLIIPSIALSFLPLFTGSLDETTVTAVTNFSLALYIMVLILLLFLFWTDYFLDMWIITSERIIDIEQHGLFSRDIAEIPLCHVQDVTLEIHGLIETFLKFGTIKIQTAGEREFFIRNVPSLYEAKEVILRYAQENSKPKNQTGG